MFYNLIYFDEDLYDTYYTFANAGQAVQYKEIESKTDKGGQLGVDSTRFGMSRSSVLKGEIINNAPSKLISLERSLENNDFYADFEAGDAFRHVEDLSRRMIFRATLPLGIHESFNMYEMTRLVKEQLEQDGLMGTRSDDVELFNIIFDFDRIKIPVYNDRMDKVIFSKIHKECLLIDENELEELEEDNIVLAKVKKTYEGGFTLFDPLKDFMNLNVELRKDLEKDLGGKSGLAPITMETDAIEVEIIAIYN